LRELRICLTLDRQALVHNEEKERSALFRAAQPRCLTGQTTCPEER
jgi:hypothetical protein